MKTTKHIRTELPADQLREILLLPRAPAAQRDLRRGTEVVLDRPSAA